MEEGIPKEEGKAITIDGSSHLLLLLEPHEIMKRLKKKLFLKILEKGHAHMNEKYFLDEKSNEEIKLYEKDQNDQDALIATFYDSKKAKEMLTLLNDRQGITLEESFTFTHINDNSCVYTAEKINDHQYKISGHHSLFGNATDINHIRFVERSLTLGFWIKC